MAKAEKVAVLGVDAMDPRLTRKYVDMGLMPNVKKLIEMARAVKTYTPRRTANRYSTTVDNPCNRRLPIHPWYHRVLSSGRRSGYGQSEL